MGQKSHGKGGGHHSRIRVVEATAKNKKARRFLVWHGNVSSAYFKVDLGDQGSENCGREILDEAKRGRLETSVLPQAPSHMIRDKSRCGNNRLAIKQLVQVCVHCVLAPSTVIEWPNCLSIWFRLRILTDLTDLEEDSQGAETDTRCPRCTEVRGSQKRDTQQVLAATFAFHPSVPG